jgi:uncharacterized protein
MPVFEKALTLPVPADELYAWHARQGAFERLAPPWDRIEVVRKQGGIEDGARLVMKVHQGPVALTWEALHRDHVEGEQFVDEQIRGPFARWIHTHRFEPVGAGTSRLVDHIDYALPMGPIGAAVGGAKARQTLDAMFAFRHRRTLEDLRRHAALSVQPLKIAITGASGVVGTALAAFLTTGGHEVIRLVRRPDQVGPGAVLWAPDKGTIDATGLEGLDAVVHLAGENVADGAWTEERRRRIRGSRVDGTDLLAKTLGELKNPPKVFVSASAIGYYGERKDEVLTEECSPGDGFLAEVCKEWEVASKPAVEAGIRTVNLRIGLVLDPRSGVLEKMLPAVKLGLASRLGAGDQYMSWVDLDDVLGAILFAIAHEELTGPVNLTAPNPVTNKAFIETMADVLGRPALVPVPSTAIELIMGKEAARQTALVSQRVLPRKLLDAGFEFYYTELADCLTTKLGLAR